MLRKLPSCTHLSVVFRSSRTPRLDFTDLRCDGDIGDGGGELRGKLEGPSSKSSSSNIPSSKTHAMGLTNQGGESIADRGGGTSRARSPNPSTNIQGFKFCGAFTEVPF